MPRSPIIGYQVSIAQFVGGVPADIQHDNFLVKVTAPKELFHRYKLWHPYHDARSPFDFAPEPKIAPLWPLPDNMPVYPGALRIADDTGGIDKRCGLTRYSCQRLAVGAPGRVLGTA
jgi:hypothetical protein